MKLWQLVAALVLVVALVLLGVAKLPQFLVPAALSEECDVGSKDKLAVSLCDEMRQGQP